MEINVSIILSTYASTVKYFITFQVLLNYVSPAPIIKFVDLHKACQTSRGGGANAQLPSLLAAPLVTLDMHAISIDASIE